MENLPTVVFKDGSNMLIHMFTEENGYYKKILSNLYKYLHKFTILI
jgi:hypothetical protein